MESNHFALKDISEIFPGSARKKAEKYLLREVEEIEKGIWAAFADDGPESFDVQITLEKGAILQHSCDCGRPDSKGFCLHQLALLLQLSAAKTTTPKAATKRKVKEDPLTTLLNQIEPDELKLWLNEVLHQQKDLAIAFTNRFTPKPEDYTAEQITTITDAAVKSVVKNKKKIDQSELKKILQLWKEVHKPVTDNYLSNIASVEKVEVLSNLLNAIQKWNDTFNINSTKIPSYKRELLALTIEPLYNIQQEQTWQAVIREYFRLGKNQQTGTDWLAFLGGLIKYETRNQRVDFILSMFKSTYLSLSSLKKGAVSVWLNELVYDLFKAADRLRDCIEWLEPIPYQNGFNLELIDQLIENQMDNRAEKMCRDLMVSNFDTRYDYPYLYRLAKIYKKRSGNRAGLHKILLDLLPHFGSLDDYLIIKEEYFESQPEAFKKWRTKILNSLIHGMRSSAQHSHLYFDILNNEGNYRKMLEKIRESFTAAVPLKYFEVLFNQDKHVFLEELSKISSGFYPNQDDKQSFAPLAEKVLKYYSPAEINNKIINKEYYWKGGFARYFEETYKEK